MDIRSISFCQSATENADRILISVFLARYALMWAELHELMDENKHLHGIEFKETVFTFLKKYDISSIQEDGLLKNYQRWRDSFRRKKKRAYNRKKV